LEALSPAVESRLDSWRSGTDRSTEGPLPGFDGHRWEIRTSQEPLDRLRGLRRVTLSVFAPDKVLERSVFRHASEDVR
jgi:hypothetical protein